MVKIACWYDTPRNESALPEYFQKLGIRYVICDARHVSAQEGQRKVSVPVLRKFKRRLTKEGIELAGVTAGWVRAETLGKAGDAATRRLILRNIEALGKADVPLAQVFVMVQAADTPVARRRQWDDLTEYCREVAAVAKKAGVKVGVHGSQARKHLVANLAGYRKLLAAVASAHFGVTLCVGCLKICGSDPARSLLALGKKVFYMHARDVIMHRDGSWTDVNLGEGQIDYPAIRRAMEKVGFSGPFQPEHLGHVSFEEGEEITMARAIGFLRGLLEPQPRGGK